MAVALLPRKPFWWVCAGILVLSPVLRYGLLAEGFRGEDIYAWTLTRADGFAAGALVSIIVRSDGFSVARARLIALGVLVSSTLALPFTIRWGLGSAVHVPRNPAAYALIFSAASVASASLLGLCLTSQRFAKWMNREPLRLLGRVSYGLYVYHLPVFFLVHLRLAPLVDSWFQLGHSLSLAVSWALAFALLLLTAWCSYRWLETPFLRLKKRFTAPSARGPS
jgi:peptidoglycan/LPS O-acetylase OafA/YrhL